MTAPESRIRWKPAGPDSDDRFGYVGTLGRAVFTLWSPREDGVSWAVSAAIPGTGQEDTECRWGASREEAMAEAESWLAGFISSAGASFEGEREKELREELGIRTRQWDRVAKDCRALTAEIIAGLSTAEHEMTMRGGLPFCQCGLSLGGGDASGSFITHALAALNARATQTPAPRDDPQTAAPATGKEQRCVPAKRHP